MARGAAAALDREARRLVERDQPLVLVDHEAADEGRILGPELSRPGLGRRSGSSPSGGTRTTCPGCEAGVGLDPLAVESELAGAAQLLELAEARRRIVRLGPAVEPPAVLLRAHGDLADLVPHARVP